MKYRVNVTENEITVQILSDRNKIWQRGKRASNQVEK